MCDSKFQHRKNCTGRVEGDDKAEKYITSGSSCLHTPVRIRPVGCVILTIATRNQRLITVPHKFSCTSVSVLLHLRTVQGMNAQSKYSHIKQNLEDNASAGDYTDMHTCYFTSCVHSRSNKALGEWNTSSSNSRDTLRLQNYPSRTRLEDVLGNDGYISLGARISLMKFTTPTHSGINSDFSATACIS